MTIEERKAPIEIGFSTVHLVSAPKKVYTDPIIILRMKQEGSKKKGVERVIIKLPHEIAAYFRASFPHGKRSQFVAECILNHKHQKEVERMEEALRDVSKRRQ